ncbi:class I SAM-dependent methyltransferase [Paenibacillus psychroresistens]|uniref:Class I SAM-dependent methyltransferase n=1 Tax=Paenibacillus psychroresistens TaxID=1778678 RepID=A0A6B8RHB8_9BACL|nr:class I SAM-dependent methyltransferase [Paenibacillus psychroresistens]QGQ95459.1 class I SAM-dependent methyltransferase [Paenibacillus psychroresistens]
MDIRIVRIRAEERKYHEELYENNKLFESGSWLFKPVKTVMDNLVYFNSYEHITVLDLGSGIGRNSIPVAEAIRSRNGKVVCVDLIESALLKLRNNSLEYGVSEIIETLISDIGDYQIPNKAFDYIIAVSALEHVESELKFIEVLNRMAQGTIGEGINCIVINTNIQEIDILTGNELEPFMELNMTTIQTEQLLSEAYQGWSLVYTAMKPLEFVIERNNRKVLMKSDCLTYVVRKK